MNSTITLNEEKIIELIENAKKAMTKAYVPYSGFRVGAALLAVDGQIFIGCNVENASYGLTNCAERTAIFKAISEGVQDFTAIAIVSDTEDYCRPCGACRQVIAEFGSDIKVIQANNRGEYIINPINDLLPGSFTAENLERGK